MLFRSGVSVIGGREKLTLAVQQTGATALLLAMTAFDQTVITDITDKARNLGLTVKVLPPISDFSTRSSLSAIRDLADEDLLGRRPVAIDMASISRYLVNQTVLSKHNIWNKMTNSLQ